MRIRSVAAVLAAAASTAVTVSACSTGSSIPTTEARVPDPSLSSDAQRALAFVERAASTDARVRDLMAPSADAFQRDEARFVSAGWRSTEQNRFGDLGVRLPEGNDTTFEVGLSRFDHLRLRVTLLGAQRRTGQITEGRVIYTDVLQDTDRVFASKLDALEEWLVLRTASSPSELGWTLQMPSGIAKTELRDGGLVFLDDKGTTTLRVAKPFSIDANGVRRELAIRWDDASKVIRVSVPHDGVAWPLVVDPLYTVGLGGTCTLSTDCAGGRSCVDGVCCSATACGNCQKCNDPTSPGACVNIRNAEDRDTCSSLDGKYCSGTGACVVGTVGCGTTTLLCANSMKDGEETDVDCGGICPTRCASAKGCILNTDCVSGSCVNFSCGAPASCTDVIKNGTESDTDCGGTCAIKCAVGQTCNGNSDCATATCVSGTCAAVSCTDVVKNGSESDVDCGGSCATQCAVGQICLASSDCQTSNCVANYCMPAASCTDVIKNGTETDVDCGGSCSTKCVDGKACLVNADCVGANCISNICAPPAEGGVLMVQGNGSTWLWNGTDWVSKPAPPSFVARDIAAPIAFNLPEHRVVLFGGRSAATFVALDETWEWDVNGWQRVKPRNVPGYRSSHMMSADPVNGVFMYGGDTSSSRYYTDQFVYKNRAWVSNRAATSPTQRSNAAMAFDAARNRHVLFGGQTANPWTGPDSANGNWNDTWTADPSSGVWTKLSPVSRPPARAYAGVAYDSVRAEVVLFGGNNPVRLNDTWVWNGTTWTQRFPGTSPSARSGGRMAWDPVTNRIILFGGYTTSVQSDTWAWDGTNWTELLPATVPTPVNNASLATYLGCSVATCTCSDASRNGTESDVDCGGSCAKCANNKTCRTNTDCSSGTCTNGVCEAATCSDTVKNGTESDVDCGAPCAAKCDDQKTCSANADCRSDRCVAGVCRAAGVFLNVSDSSAGPWIWDGVGWAEQTGDPFVNPASSGWGHSLAYNSTTKKIVRFGGGGGGFPANGEQDTWQWDLSGWTQLFPTNIPPRRYGSSMTYDPIMGGVLMFGGQIRPGSYVDLKDTYFFGLSAGTNWTVQAPTTVPAWRSFACMAYDSLRRVHVMFGGTAFNAPTPTNSETWEYDSVAANWTKKTPTVVPPQYSYCAMAFDPVRGQTVLYSGFGSDWNTYIWNGTDWTAIVDPGAPGPRTYSSMAWDPVRQEIMLYSGSDSGSVPSWYYSLHGGAWNTPNSDMWSWDGYHWQRKWYTGTIPPVFNAQMTSWAP